MKLHLDELFLHMKGTFYYLWDSICAETKFACWFLSQTRRLEDADLLLKISPSPVKLVTDGAFAYLTPIRQSKQLLLSYPEITSSR
jgi:transposase-like protein